MMQTLREKALQVLLNRFLMEIQCSNQKIVECCLQQPEITVEFLEALRRYAQGSEILSQEIFSLSNEEEGALKENGQERRQNVSIAMKELFESKALRLSEVGKIVDLSRPVTSLIVSGDILPNDTTTLKGEMFFQSFSVEELRRLFLPLPSGNQQ